MRLFILFVCRPGREDAVQFVEGRGCPPDAVLSHGLFDVAGGHEPHRAQARVLRPKHVGGERVTHDDARLLRLADASEADEPEEAAAESEEAAAEPARKKRSILPVVLGAIVGLLAIIIVCLAITLTTLSKTGKMPAFVTSIQNAFHREHFDADAVAVRILDENGAEASALDTSGARLFMSAWASAEAASGPR